MKKDPKGKDKKRIINLMNDLSYPFGIQNFDKEILWRSDDEEIEWKRTMASIIVDEKYQRCTVNIFPCFFLQTGHEQRKTLLHELIHTITLPLAEKADMLLQGKLVTQESIDFESERSTSRIENIFDGLLTGKYKFLKKAYKDYL